MAATGMAALAKGNVAVGAGGECDLGCSKEGSVSTNPTTKGFQPTQTGGNKRRKSSSTQEWEKYLPRDIDGKRSSLNFR